MTTRNSFEDLERRIAARRHFEVEGSPEAALAGLAARVEERRSTDAPTARDQLDDSEARIEVRRAEVEGEPAAAQVLERLEEAVEARRSEASL